MTSNRRRHPPPPSDTDINILLLGQTGVGKTTFVNGFVNSLFYNKLDDALNGELKVLIPSSFSLTHPDTFNSLNITVGNPHKNENCKDVGQSSTQLCRTYVFPIGNRMLRLIDGPGVGDTRGVDHEARNFEHILSYITNYEYLNGICILLRPAETRLDIFFRYCIKELLRRLHVNAKDNIMFVFTSARSTFYQPGGTTALLKVLLGQIKQNAGVEIPFNIGNTFMLDNESFRYLAVCKQGHDFLKKDKGNYTESWNKSVEEFYRLLIRIFKCDRHAVRATQSLNDVQLLIQQLSRPIAEIVTLIQENISMAKHYKEKLLNDPTDRNSNKIPQKTGRFIPLRERLTVCVSEKCTEVINSNSERHINYKSTCHQGCSLHRVVQECIGHPIIQRCRALRKTGSCRNCGCSWMKHMHITYKYERNLQYVEINDLNSFKTPQSIEKIIDKRLSDLKNEERSIRKCCAKLAQFLKTYSILPFNDDFTGYLEHFLYEEKQKRASGADNLDVIKGLEEMIKDYKNEVKLYDTCITPEQKEKLLDQFDNMKQIDDIFSVVQELYALPINGKLIEEQIRKMEQGRAQAAQRDEEFIELPAGFNAPDVLQNLKKVISGSKQN